MSGSLATFGADVSRETGRYALGGRPPSFAVRPSSAAEAAEVLRACTADRLALVPWGGGVALEGEEHPGRYDVALDLTGLDRITTYDPDDFTVSAECGVPIEALRRALGEHGHELPLEGGRADRATLGGVLAANASGPRRLRFGSPRDRILGARFVTGDGVLARTGGRVVKNVAGHAVHRLLVGSRGGLGVLLEASLKLLPLPPARLALAYGCDAAALGEPARWAGCARREPAVLTVLGRTAAAGLGALASNASRAPFTFVLGWEDDAAWLAECEAFARARFGEPAQRTEGAGVPALWQALADAGEAPGPRLSFASAHNSPAALAPLAGRTVADRLVFHAPSGRLLLWPAPDEAGALVAELASHGFTLTEARAVPASRGTPPAAIAALRGSLRSALDPAHVLAFGERWQAGFSG
jgi:glycolate oxidase FAD binding subunit